MTSVDDSMDECIKSLKSNLMGIRTGRAHPSMLDTLLVSAYGSEMKLRDCASISVPETSQLLIMPYDPNLATSIEKSINDSNLGFRACREGISIRVTIPPLDQDMRKELCRHVKKMGESAKVEIRSKRNKEREGLLEQKKAKLLTEDDVYRKEKDLDKQTQKHCELVDQIVAAKEREILTV